MTTNTQLRGHCQVCGRQHAIVGGGVAKHGYTVKCGWFNGVCKGQHYAPVEINRDKLDQTVALLRDAAENRRAAALDLEQARVRPNSARTGRSTYAIVQGRRVRVDEAIHWADASPAQQQKEIELLVWEHSRDAQRAQAAANALLAFADRLHGKPLLQVAKPAAPEAVPYGDKRVLGNGRVATARDIHRGMVRWMDERGFSSKMSTRSWRLLAKG